MAPQQRHYGHMQPNPGFRGYPRFGMQNPFIPPHMTPPPRLQMQNPYQHGYGYGGPPRFPPANTQLQHARPQFPPRGHHNVAGYGYGLQPGQMGISAYPPQPAANTWVNPSLQGQGMPRGPYPRGGDGRTMHSAPGSNLAGVDPRSLAVLQAQIAQAMQQRRDG